MKLSRQEIAVIALTVALLLIIGAIILTVAGVYTGGFKHEFRYFYVSAGKTKYLQNADVVLGNVQFKAHYVLKKNVDYTTKVIPAGENFYYQVDGYWKSFADLDDVTAAFDIVQHNKRFVIHCRDKTMQNVLQTLYPDSEVFVPWDDIDEQAHFQLVITAGDGSQSIALTFRCYISVGGVELDPPSLLI